MPHRHVDALRSYDSRVRGSLTVSYPSFDGSRLLVLLTRKPCLALPNTFALRTNLRECLPPDTLLALYSIIATVPEARGWYSGHFLRPLCLFRQPPPNPAVRLLNRPPAWPAPVSACQHGL